jgi:hypothetical protein
VVNFCYRRVIEVVLIQCLVLRRNVQVDINLEGADLSMQKLIDLEALNVR